ncbi:hypothetical protein Tco_1407607 [Tanacetum coccineum]
MTCSTAITPDSPKTDSLIMEDEHLDTIPETESDEFIKSSVEGLVQNPSESEDERECDVPDCDDSQMTNFSTFSNPLFDDSSLVLTSQVHEEDTDIRENDEKSSKNGQKPSTEWKSVKKTKSNQSQKSTRKVKVKAEAKNRRNTSWPTAPI